MSEKYIFQLSYLSEGVHPFSEPELAKLLEVAREKNEGYGITGILVYNKGVFLQLLEGEEKAVQKLYQVIEKDPRHQNLHSFFENYTPQRMFSNWSMAYHNIEYYQPETVRRLHNLVYNFHQTDIVATRNEWVTVLKAIREEI